MALPRIYTDENAARRHLEKLQWPDGPICPHCGTVDEATLLQGESTRPGLYKCRACAKPFSVTVGTLFERSKIGLPTWLYAVHLYTSSKKGFSAHQLHRTLKVTYKTAWFMAHRIREAMGSNEKLPPMGGNRRPVQADETYIGGTSKRAKNYKRGLKHKGSVVALVDSTTGEARAFHVETANAQSVREILRTNASRKAILVTDESSIYTKVGREFSDHQKVLHDADQYVTRDGFTTNNVENFFGIFKRGMKGVYHFCGQQHLQKYLNEFSFRYSNRSGVGIEDAERADLALKGIAGKRLTYRRPNNSKVAQA